MMMWDIFLESRSVSGKDAVRGGCSLPRTNSVRKRIQGLGGIGVKNRVEKARSGLAEGRVSREIF
ncbi:MAG: hypothetical protein D6679_13620 [Candidatus Hydrogenedentota bacterium]|nr:MAG: hypothetical protein D6679_13620 [Candidatus Hydrogenedentota bacterium]